MRQGRVRIKFCGMTRKEDVAYAQALGVDAIGFIFAKESSRCLSIEKAKELLNPSPLFMDAVAVLVNPDKTFVKRILTELPIQWLQFHGDESPAFCDQFNHPYFKAIPAVSTKAIEDAIKQYPNASAILLETPSETQRGGSGEPFDWGIIPKHCEKPLMLAGGLNPSTVAKAVEIGNPCAVDVCSGIEFSPGVKDPEKMTLFVQALGGLR